jgi:hypothetical protein
LFGDGVDALFELRMTGGRSVPIGFFILIVVSGIGTLRFFIVIAAQVFSQPRADLLNTREKLVVGGFSLSVFATVDIRAPYVVGHLSFLLIRPSLI